MMIGGAGEETSDFSPSARPAEPAASEKAALAALFPQFEILETLGRGGMGVVYKARQIKLDRLVALKVIRPDAVHQKHFAERFQREALAMARLQHPGIVMIHDYGEVDGLYYLVMELVDGGDLRAPLARGKLAQEAALLIALQVCEAIEYAHGQGIIHRDIKPENILRTRSGQVKIADFGLAKLLQPSEAAPLTQTRQVMGTPHYMAPEQLERPREADHRADIYSLGVLIYEMFTGSLPLGRYELPSEQLGTDEHLDDIIAKALARDPNARFQRIGDLRRDLLEFAEGYDLAEAWSSPEVRASLIGSEPLRSKGDGDSSWSSWWLLPFFAILVAWPLLNFIVRTIVNVADVISRAFIVRLGGNSTPAPTWLALVVGLGLLAGAARALWVFRCKRFQSSHRGPSGWSDTAMPATAKGGIGGAMQTKPQEWRFLATLLTLFLISLLGLVVSFGCLVYGLALHRGDDWQLPLAFVSGFGLGACVLGWLTAVFWKGMEQLRSKESVAPGAVKDESSSRWESF
jgi:serine/threonine protein kinase